MRREEGQVIVIMVLFLTVLCGFAGLVVDIGRVYVAQRQLQQAVDASALAAAQDLPVTATAASDVTTFSALSGQKNAHPGLIAAAAVATYKCLSSTGLSCQSGSGNCSCNAIQVKESASVNTTFLRVLGFNSFANVSSTSTASMHGGTPHPLDVAVVLDTTASMNSACGNTVAGISSGATKIDCAKEGVRALLTSLDPCSPKLASCGSVTSGNVAQPLDEVSLFTFPGLAHPTSFTHDTSSTYSNVALELGCPGGLTTNPSWYTPTSDSTNETENVVVNATGGTYKLAYAGQTTAAISYGAPASSGSGNFLGKLTALSNIGPSDVAVTSSTSGNVITYSITFQTNLGNQDIPSDPAISVSSNSLTGSGTPKTVVATTTHDGNSEFPNWYLNSGDVSYPSGSANYPSYTTVGLSSDYRANDVTSTLTSSSKLVDAVSWLTCNNSTWPGNEYYGINAPGGAGTYIAYSINAAQAALAADSSRHATPVMIVLSDGDASTQPSGSTDPCHEAIAAADAADTAGTEIYSIAYDADNTSSSCTQDSGTYGSLTGFTTMQAVASDNSKFYCLNPPSGQTCNNASASSLAQIFTAIGIDVTNARLLPDNAS